MFSRAHRFVAEGLDVPITADARSLAELRRLLADAAEKYLGRQTRIILLVGMRRGPQATHPHVQGARSRVIAG